MITLSWSAAPEVKAFTVYDEVNGQKLDATELYGAVPVQQDGWSVSFGPVSNGMHRFGVAPYVNNVAGGKNHGAEVWTNETEVTLPGLARPVLLTVEESENVGGIDVEWAFGADDSRCIVIYVDGEIISEINGKTSYTIPELKKGVHKIALAAKKDDQIGLKSEEKTVVTYDPDEIAQPQKLTAVYSEETASVALNWEAGADVTDRFVVYETSADGDIALGETTTCTYTINDVYIGQHSYYVAAMSTVPDAEPCVGEKSNMVSVSVLNMTKDGVSYTLNLTNHALTLISAKDTASTVVIPAEINGCAVAEIAAGAFEGNKTLKSVTIPKSVKKIGKRAFAACPSLSEMK